AGNPKSQIPSPKSKIPSHVVEQDWELGFGTWDLGFNVSMSLIEPGKKAPTFALNDQTGKVHKLADYAGRPVILYFYPKDDTPGCTKETCSFQSYLPKFKPSKAAVLGV